MQKWEYTKIMVKGFVEETDQKEMNVPSADKWVLVIAVPIHENAHNVYSFKRPILGLDQRSD